MPSAFDSRPPVKDAYELILDAIDTGVYKPGSRLVESELADRFGVSRTPIREALQRLETQSLLTRDGRSLIVASLDHSQLSELYVVRGALEGLAARLAAQHATEEELSVLLLQLLIFPLRKNLSRVICKVDRAEQEKCERETKPTKKWYKPK